MPSYAIQVFLPLNSTINLDTTTDMLLATLVLAFLSGALATPLKRTAIAPKTATCEASFCSQGHGGPMTCYKIHIGRPYIQGGGCQSIQDNLRDEVKYLGNYICQDDGAGQTSLSFDTSTNAASNTGAIDALQKSYPDVPFQAERICLMEGTPVPENWPPTKSNRDIDNIDDFLSASPDGTVSALDITGIVDDDHLATSSALTT